MSLSFAEPGRLLELAAKRWSKSHSDWEEPTLILDFSFLKTVPLLTCTVDDFEGLLLWWRNWRRWRHGLWGTKTLTGVHWCSCESGEYKDETVQLVLHFYGKDSSIKTEKTSTVSVSNSQNSHIYAWMTLCNEVFANWTRHLSQYVWRRKQSKEVAGTNVGGAPGSYMRDLEKGVDIYQWTHSKMPFTVSLCSL